MCTCIYSTFVHCPTSSIDLSNAFGLLVQWPEDPQEKLLVFRIDTEDVSYKTNTVQQLAKLMAEAQFSTNTVRGYKCIYYLQNCMKSVHNYIYTKYNEIFW